MQRKVFEHGAWLWIVLSGATVSAVVFDIWEMIQQSYFQDLDYHTLHYLYITRGVALAVFLATCAACIVVAHLRSYIARLRRSEMKYRQLIEEARDAIVVVDRRGIVHEWKPQASQFFGFTRDEVLGRPLPTLPSSTQEVFLSPPASCHGARGI